MSIFLYFVPGIIAAGGVLAYDYFKRVGVAKALQIMSIILYIIGGMIMLPQISGAYQDFMRIMSRADEGTSVSLKHYLAVLSYVVIATFLLFVADKIQNKQNEKKSND